MRFLASLLAGAVFGVGMAISGMTNPERVLGFFDVAGAWDPTLAFVMGGAMLPMIVAWRIRAGMATSVLGEELPGPPSKTIDAKLVGGAAVFGVGWGIAGICPGAVVPALAYGGWPVSVFALGLIAGLMLHGRLTATPTAATA
jgi:uncharacterized membrane protein YedE/YeeE